MTKKTAKGKTNSGKKSRKAAPPPKPLIQLSLDQKLDIFGVVLVGIGVLTILSMVSQTQGTITGEWITTLRQSFGIGVFVVPIAFVLAGVWLLLRSFERTPRLSGEQIVGVIMFYLVALITLSEFHAPVPGSSYSDWGGTVGGGLMNFLENAIGFPGTIVLLIVGWLIAIVLLFNVAPSEIAAWFGRLFGALRRERPSASPIGDGRLEDIAINVNRRPQSTPASNGNGRNKQAPSALESDYSQLTTEQGAAESISAASDRISKLPIVQPRARPDAPPSGMLGDQSMSLPAQSSNQAAGISDQPATGPLYAHIIGGEQAWTLPTPTDIFEGGDEATMSEDDLRGKARIIEETLHSFGVEGKVIEVNRGPTVTQFGVEPGFVMRAGKETKVKVSKISALADDLALALAAKTIRIEAPVPGKGIVGIEVPNNEVSKVALLDVIESESFQNMKGHLRIALGQDVSGQAISADLANMPHLLIAGTTGSGKSVCVNAIISCLMSYNTPDELKFLMVDPKRVELTTYNGVPHLLAPVIVDLERVVGVLQWVTREMDERYRKFAKSGSRNIDDYNVKAVEAGTEKLPYIVVVIDELADLMMLAPDETEKTICRLAQMARATGIHLIIATQRPSVDVVTGLIKANFPARIAFSVASSVDSRVILDTTGAERLLGRGDMLYVAPEIGAPQRLQGCFVGDREINKLVRYWKGIRGAVVEGASKIPGFANQPQQPVQATQPPLWDSMREIDAANANGEDDLLQRAIDVVKAQRKASISLLQRQLRIGYTRAARLIDLMEEKGIVGPVEEGNRWREVMFDSPLLGELRDKE
jgi:S-DNA-T family DNA segregation ATPase FtsK/SpoIIIE